MAPAMPDRILAALRLLFAGLAVAFAATGLLFFLCPDGTLGVLNAAGSPLGFPPAPPSALRFWLSLGLAYMVLVTLLAAQIARDPRGRAHLMPLLAAGKATSSLTCAGYFVLSMPAFIYLANALVDGALAAIALGARACARRLGHLSPRAAPAAPRQPEAPRLDALLRAPGGLARHRLRRRPPPAAAARRAERRAPRRAARDMTDGATVAHDVHELAEVVVVGSGAGGAVVARELAARGRDVLLVEEGGFFTGKDFTGNPRAMIDLLYRGRGLTGALGRPTIPIPLGRCVGGTTTINSGTCYRAPDYVLDEWAERYGVRGAREADLRPYFERVEQELNVRPVPDETYGRNSTLFERGAAALGYAGARIPRNERGCLGTGVCAFGCPQDAKQAMHVSYVPRALAAGARLFTRCRVDPILLSAGKAMGVVGRFIDADERETGHELRVPARHVVVACGALLTPALLERSGVPDPSGLRGRNLHIHPATRGGALFDEEVRGWEEVPQAYNVHHFTREGIFIQGQFVPPAMEAPVLPGVGTAHKEIMARYTRLGSFGALISDESAGRVPAGRARFPRVTYQLGAADAKKLARAIGLTAEIFFAAGAREVYSGVHSRPVLRSLDEARALRLAALPAADFLLMAVLPP